MGSIIILIGIIAQVIFWMVLVQFVISLLIQFDILNRRQPMVWQIYNGIDQLLSPLLSPIRRIMPPAGGLDFSPMVLLIALYFLQIVLARNFGGL